MFKYQGESQKVSKFVHIIFIILKYIKYKKCTTQA